MNVFVWVLLAALAAAAAASWRAACGPRGGDVRLARAVFTVLLLALAWLLGADTVGYGRWLLLGVLLSLGSIGPAGRSTLRRGPSTVALLVSRVAYVVAVLGLPPGDGPRPVPLLLVAGAVLAVLVAVVRAGAARGPAAGVPLLGYAAATALLPLAAWSTGHAVVGWAATLLGAGDLLGAHGRATRPSTPAPRAAPLRVLPDVLADVGSVLLVVGSLRV